jgi:hypothetical protein
LFKEIIAVYIENHYKMQNYWLIKQLIYIVTILQ